MTANFYLPGSTVEAIEHDEHTTVVWLRERDGGGVSFVVTRATDAAGVIAFAAALRAAALKHMPAVDVEQEAAVPA